MSNKQLSLPPEISTVQEVMLLINNLERIERQLKSGSVLTENIGITLQGLFEHNKLSITEVKDIVEVEQYLRKVIKDHPIVLIKSPQPLNEKFSLKLTKWFRAHVNPEILLNCRVDRTLLAGITVQTPKTVYDLSLAGGLSKGRDYIKKMIELP